MSETCTREQAGQRALDLVMEMRDLLKNEELWAVAKKHLDRAYLQGMQDERDDS